MGSITGMTHMQLSTQVTPHLYNGADASTPGAPLPRGTTILFAYIGEASKPGAPDTPHIWTPDDINRYMSPDGDLYGGPYLRVVPIYTKSYADNPVTDAINACDAMSEYGWWMAGGRLLFWDAEALVDPAYTIDLADACYERGVRLGKYGQLSAINHNPPVPGGTWFAEWGNVKPSAIPQQLGVAWQWASPAQVHGAWDRSVCDPFVYHNAGRGPRRDI